MTLYLKYRPQTIDELDLEDVRSALTKIVKSGKIPHAFLFSGPKGTGKTSAARIIAKIVNCERRRKGSIIPCNKCDQCVSITNGSNVDVIELDAASHRGIDDVRAIKEAVKLASARAKCKVYIIDEAHMLTTEASNALLKTLEEPPEHVMFILATTNPEKLIVTIRSRTMNIIFKRASVDEIVRSLKKKVKGEKLVVDDKVLRLIAEASDYSFRDADKILEQLLSESKSLKVSQVEDFLFHKATFNTDKFILALIKRDSKSALEMIEKAVESGGSAVSINKAVIERLRNCLLAKFGLEGEDIVSLDKNDVVLLIKLFTHAASNISSAYLEQIPLEIAIVEWCSIDESGKKKGVEDDDGDRGIKKEQSLKGKQENMEFRNEQRRRKAATANEISEEIWSKILSEIRPKNTSTEALLRATRPIEFDGKNLKLGVYYAFHKERLETNPHCRILEEVAGSVIGCPVRVVYTIARQLERKGVEEKDKVDSQGAELDSATSEVVLTESEDEDIIKVAEKIFGS
jgi:DNA polymerase-3 subunit gamma/tau